MPRNLANRFLISWAAGAVAAFAGTAVQAATCPNGAKVDDAVRCSYFMHYAEDFKPVDPRIQARLGARKGDYVRSIAIIVGISDYPHAGSTLQAAANDAEHLVNYAKNEGKFDEVVLLSNNDANEENIFYFLKDYLVHRSLSYNGRTRVLFAYSGHGAADQYPLPARLILSQSTGLNDESSSHYISMSALRDALQTAAKGQFQLLALINACYGGNVFSSGPSGFNPDDVESPSGIALTAGPAGDLVWSLGGQGEGSIFFDFLLQGIHDGAGDPLYQLAVDRSGALALRAGVTRLGALNTFVTTKIDNLNDARTQGDPKKKFAMPWVGSITSSDSQRGGFFFLSRPYVSDKIAASNPPGVAESFALNMPVRTASSIPGHPELKVFLGAASYPIHGIDVSHFNGAVDWPKVYSGGISFAYIKATQGARFVDPLFRTNWTGAEAAGLSRGAYHFVDLCGSVDDQYSNIVSTVPKRAHDLPIALDIEPNGFYSGVTKFDFSKPTCRSHSAEDARKLIDSLAAKLEVFYGKTPIIFGVAPTWRDLLDARFARYNIWLTEVGGASRPDLGLTGDVPWTVWQYATLPSLPGIKGKIDGNVFFGDAATFEQFRSGNGNIALTAATTAAP